MKTISTLFLVGIISLNSFGQNSSKDKTEIETPLAIKMDSVSKKYYYSDVVPVNDISAKKLYARAKDYLTKHYSSNKFIIEDSLELHQRVKGSFGATIVLSVLGTKSPTSTNIVFEVDVLFKDGKYKYNITNINISDYKVVPLEAYMKMSDSLNKAGKAMQKKTEKALMEEIDRNMVIEIKSLKDALSKEKSKDNW